MNARLAARLTGWKIDIQSDTEFAQAEAEAAFGGGDGEGGGGLLRPLRRDPRERQALPERGAARARGTAACRRTRSSPCRSRTTRTTRSSSESEPGLEALADVTEPDSVTEDSAEFAPLDPDDDAMPAGPGDAPVAAVGEEVSVSPEARPRGRRSGRRHSVRDDRRGGGGARLSPSGRAPAAAGARRSVSCIRFAAARRRARRGPNGAGSRRLHLPQRRVLRPRCRARPVRARPAPASPRRP